MSKKFELVRRPVLLMLLLLGALCQEAVGQTANDDEAAEFSLLAKGFEGRTLYLLMKLSYRTYEQLLVLHRTGSKGDFKAVELAIPKKMIDAFCESRGLRASRLSIAEASWDSGFKGGFEVYCEDETTIMIPFRWTKKSGLELGSDEQWKVRPSK